MMMPAAALQMFNTMMAFFDKKRAYFKKDGKFRNNNNSSLQNCELCRSRSLLTEPVVLEETHPIKKARYALAILENEVLDLKNQEDR